MKIQLFDILAIVAVLSYFVPLLIVHLKNLWKDVFFLMFAIYWAVGGLVNICDILPFVPANVGYKIGVLYNMLDFPFIMAIFYCTTSSLHVRKAIPYAAAVLLCMEIVGIWNAGFVYDAFKYSLGSGIVMVLVIVGIELTRYMQTLEHSNRQNAKMFVYAAVLFEYATFIFPYISDYFIKTKGSLDSYLIYYFSTLGAILIASCGYLLSRRYNKVKTLS